MGQYPDKISPSRKHDPFVIPVSIKTDESINFTFILAVYVALVQFTGPMRACTGDFFSH